MYVWYSLFKTFGIHYKGISLIYVLLSQPFICFFFCCIIQHVEAPVPNPLKDEVLIKVEASTVNPIDCKIQGGMLRPILPRKFPFIPRKFDCVVFFLCIPPSSCPVIALVEITLENSLAL